jgi:hypothetical protein
MTTRTHSERGLPEQSGQLRACVDGAPYSLTEAAKDPSSLQPPQMSMYIHAGIRTTQLPAPASMHERRHILSVRMPLYPGCASPVFG